MQYTPEELISCFLFNALTKEKAAAFSEWIKADPENSRALIRSAMLHRGIHDYFGSKDTASRQLIEEDMKGLSASGIVAFKDEMWAALSKQEQNAPAVHIQKEESNAPVTFEPAAVQASPRVYSKGTLWFSIISIAASFLLCFYVWTHPRHIPQDVATLVDLYQAKWLNLDEGFKPGDRLFDSGSSFNLAQGIAKIQFDNGAQVVVEGPAEFSFESSERMRLTYGKLYAKVPKQAVGFRVNTPACGVIDLGTEFGMDVTSRGETNVHLFKGKASLVTSFDRQSQQSQVLYKEQAKSVSGSGTIAEISFQERRFIRDFDSGHNILWNGEKLSLASIASGGRGFGKAPVNQGLDPSSGTLVSNQVEQRSNVAIEGYIPIVSLPFVDGIFVPDGEKGPVRLTSAGHSYDGFGDTDGRYFMPIGSYTFVTMYHTDGLRNTPLALEGFAGETAENLCVHANSGITFDLQKIRESMPFVNITGFSSSYGMTKPRKDQDVVASNFYVFVDGVPCLEKKSVSNLDEPCRIDIPLTAANRFLTLVCTQGDQNFGDWSLFVNPMLTLELSE